MAELTPMRRQYIQMKERYPDCILFFRLGDFYEMFDEDARLASKELELTLTTRDRNKPAQDQTPMCGVPYHSVEAYISFIRKKLALLGSSVTVKAARGIGYRLEETRPEETP